MIRIGLVGCGHIGSAHAYVLQQLGDAHLVDARLAATYDADHDRAARVARRHDAIAMTSLAELVRAVDVVWVCTWTAAHFEGVEAAAAAGLPIFCEKPLGPDLATAERVAHALETVPHLVGLVLRSAPVFANAAAAIASGNYGHPLSVVFRDDQYFPIQGMYGSTWRCDVASAGGGTLIEHSIHDVDVLRWLLGEAVCVSARTANHFGHPGIEDTAAATFTYASGCVAQLTSVWHQVLTRESTRRVEVFCEKAVLWTEDDYLGPLHVQTDDGPSTIEAKAPEWTSRFTVPEAYANAVALYATPTKAFLDALSSSTPNRHGGPTAGDALAAHRLVDVAYRSAAGGGAAMEVAPT
jgi:predicted dehydrogenase